MADVKVFPPMSEREIKGAEICRRAAAEGMVLLKNEGNTLPLAAGQTLALFGNGAARTVRGGTGSGDPFNGGLSGGGDANINLSPRYHINILDAMEEEYTIPTGELLRGYAVEYDRARDAQKDHVMSVFAFPEQKLTKEMAADYRKQTGTALFVISRNSGEGNDRAMTQQATIDGKTVEIGDYRLAETEKENLKLLRKVFDRLVLILNVAGPVSVEDLDQSGADAILLMGQAGQEGGRAVVDILTGKVTPSGKLAATWAEKYEDYPTSDVFLKDPIQAPYPEGIYVGYRYFDTFDKHPGYPFGYGLSYTTFALDGYHASLDGDVLTLADVDVQGVRETEETPVLFHLSTGLVLNMMDRLMGGEGEGTANTPAGYSFTALELKLYEDILKDMIGILGGSWENYIDLNFAFRRVESNPTLVQLIGLDETVVIIGISIKFTNATGRMSICLPGMMLTNIFTKIAAMNQVGRGSGENNSQEIMDILRDSRLEVTAELGRTQLTLRDIYFLNVGDVVDLGHPTQEPIHLYIGGQPWFGGKLGTQGNSMAVKISDTYHVQTREEK